MPLQPWMKLLSTDDHLIEPPGLWMDRLPARYRLAGPRIVEQFRGASQPPTQVWNYDDRIYPYIGLDTVTGKQLERSEIEPAHYDAKARLREMDLTGVWGAVCFPSFPGFAGTVFLRGRDRLLALLCVRAWNDFVLEQWCAAAPDRFIPLVILPLWDVRAAVAEIRRTAAMGAKAISFPENPVPLGLPSFHTGYWDPVFFAAEDTDMPICLHAGTSGRAPRTAPEAPFAVTTALSGCAPLYTTADLLFSPVLHRHPRLKIGLSGGGIGWIPYLLERIDSSWERHRFHQNINQDVRPSDLFARHFHSSFLDDRFGIEMRHRIGVDTIIWQCDYPHSDSYWPDSRAHAAEVLACVPDDEAHRIVELNTRRLYNFPAMAEMTSRS